MHLHALRQTWHGDTVIMSFLVNALTIHNAYTGALIASNELMAIARLRDNQLSRHVAQKGANAIPVQLMVYPPNTKGMDTPEQLMTELTR